LVTSRYGDYVPLQSSYYVFTLTYVLVGLALMTMSLDLIAGEYIKKIHFFGRKIILAKEALRNAKVTLRYLQLFYNRNTGLILPGFESCLTAQRYTCIHIFRKPTS